MAEEVRRLAQSAAEAARETTGKVDDTDGPLLVRTPLGLLGWHRRNYGAIHPVETVSALDGDRIHQLARQRRAANRMRSYCIIAACACGVVAIELIWMAVRWLRTIGATPMAP